MNALVAELNCFAEVFVSSYAWPILWQSSLLALIVAAASGTVFRKASPQFRYWLWLLVVVRLFLSPALYLPTGIGNWGRALWAFVPRAGEPTGTATAPALSTSVFPAATLDLASGAESLSWCALLLLTWLGGVVVLLTFLVIKLIRFHRMLLWAAPPAEDLTRLVERCAHRLGLRRPVRVRVTSRLPGPVVCGLLRPTILIPERILLELGEREQVPILLHELAHIKRRDWLVNWVQLVAGVLYFFNPVLWLVNRCIRIEREKACDDTVVVALSFRRKRYVNSLLKVVERTPALRPALMPGLLGVVELRSKLASRMLRILDRDTRPTARLRPASILALLGFACCFLTFTGKWVEAQSSPDHSVFPERPRLRELRTGRPKPEQDSVQIKTGEKIYCAWSQQLLHNKVTFDLVAPEEAERFYDDGTHYDEIPFDGLPSRVLTNSSQYIGPYALAIKEKMEGLRDKVLTQESIDRHHVSRWSEEDRWDPCRFYAGLHVTSLDGTSSLPQYSEKLKELSRAMEAFDQDVIEQFRGYEYYPDKEYPEREQALWNRVETRDPKVRQQWGGRQRNS